MKPRFLLCKYIKYYGECQTKAIEMSNFYMIFYDRRAGKEQAARLNRRNRIGRKRGRPPFLGLRERRRRAACSPAAMAAGALCGLQG